VRRPRGGVGRRGFSLLELVLALLVFEVGVLGVAGMVYQGQRTLSRAQLIMRGTLEAKRVADSILTGSGTGAGAGNLLFPWGEVAWAPAGGGVLRIVATGSAPSDTLAALLAWPRPGGEETGPFLEVPGGGGSP